MSEQFEQLALDDESETWEEFIARMNDPEQNPQMRKGDDDSRQHVRPIHRRSARPDPPAREAA